MEIHETTKCPDCLSRDIVQDLSRGETHCADCGLVIASDEIDQGEDWRTYEGGEDQSRVGAPKSVLSPDHGLMTTISHANADFAGRSLSGVTRSQFYRLRKWQRRTTVHNRVERNMQKALLELDRIIAALGLTRAAKEEAAAEKIRVVAAAEAEAESKKLQGEGIANQRIAIANGMKQSVEEVKVAMDEGVTGQEVMNMLFLTQHYDTVSRLGDNGASTIFMPYSPSTVGDLQTQIQASLLAVDGLKNQGQTKSKSKPKTNSSKE